METGSEDVDLKDGDSSSLDHELEKGGEADWRMLDDVKMIKQSMEVDQTPPMRLGLTWKNLTVQSPGADASFQENVFSQFNIPRIIKESRHPPPLKTILADTHGCVRPGEMLLVLGRPGAGCTTLLKMLSNRRAGYQKISGDVRFGHMNPKEAQRYRGQITMNTEEVSRLCMSDCTRI